MTNCLFCKKEFQPKRNYKKYQAKFCSRKCAGKWQSQNRRGKKAFHWKGGKIEKVCLVCGKKFYIIPAKKNSRFCSQECYWKWLKGQKRKPLSNKTKEKIGKANSRKVVVECSYCGKKVKRSPSAFKGKKRYFCSRECYAKFVSEFILKEETSNWQGGINDIRDTERKTREIKEWKKKVLKRQNWTCQKCDKRGGRLEVHHIENFSSNGDKRALLKNGIVFCKKCHTKFHKRFGYKNNTREQLNKFLN